MNDEGAAEVTDSISPVSLVDVAGTRINLLSGLGTLLYLPAALMTDGGLRWALIAIGMVLLSALAFARKNQAPALVVTLSFMITAFWGWLAPTVPHIAVAGVILSVIHAALTLPRPYAEVSITAGPLGAAVTAFTHGLRSGDVAQVVALATMIAALGVVLLGIRLTTERRFNEHTTALADLNVQLGQLSRTDTLTGLANRRQFDDMLEGTWTQAQKLDQPVGLIMIDIDHFKGYNDHYGHQGGDACLQKVAAVVRASIRESDLASRYGGEEFTIVAPNSSLSTTTQLAERIRLAVAGLQEQHAASPDGLITVSMGVAAVIPSVGFTAQDLVEHADRGLYEAKRAGRNRVAPFDAQVLR